MFSVSGNKNAVDKDFLEVGDVEKIKYWLSRFVAEVRNVMGASYPPKTIQNLLSGLQRHMLECCPTAPKFLDHNNVVFRDFHRSCDYVHRDLHSSGVGTHVSHAKTFTRKEDQLWDSGILSTSSPKTLQRATFYYVGKHFCIRGGHEQRKLSPSQFVRLLMPTHMLSMGLKHIGRIGAVKCSQQMCTLCCTSRREALLPCLFT